MAVTADRISERSQVREQYNPSIVGCNRLTALAARKVYSTAIAHG
jgi:hypothetical protein